MCHPASFVVTRERVLWDRDGDSHGGIIKDNGLDDGLHGADFVRCEIVPPKSNYSLPLSDWRFIVDQDLLPTWWNHIWAEQECRKALPEWAKTHIFESGQVMCKTRQTRILVGTAILLRQTGGTVFLFGQSQSHDQIDGVAYLHNQSQSHGQRGGLAVLLDQSQSHGQTDGEASLNDQSQSHGQTGGKTYLCGQSQSHGQTGGYAALYDQSQSHDQRGGVVEKRSHGDPYSHVEGEIWMCGPNHRPVRIQ